MAALKLFLNAPGASPIWPTGWTRRPNRRSSKSATDFPACGQARTSNELRKLGVFVSPSGVRSIWLRHDLANFKTRLKALEAKVAEEGGILTEAQVQALEKKKLDDEACGEIETAHLGYLGSDRTRSMLALSRVYGHLG